MSDEPSTLGSLFRALATCRKAASCVAQTAMDEGRLISALDRAERALARIERSVAQTSHSNGKDQELRAKVREAVAELDQIIRLAENA